ncbi:MAG: hypothetical protein JWO77_2686 [Ilumatobacteraceae bacterium]|nr:hypothetical protein [Ilumatobacteraceae bacterium]
MLRVSSVTRKPSSTLHGVLSLLAASDSGAFLGDDLLPFLVLAMGGALLAGNLAAIIKPPTKHRGDDDLERAPVGRSIAMAVLGGIAAVWALASLLT